MTDSPAENERIPIMKPHLNHERIIRAFAESLGWTVSYEFVTQHDPDWGRRQVPALVVRCGKNFYDIPFQDIEADDELGRLSVYGCLRYIAFQP